MPWLPDGFRTPAGVGLPTGDHLGPVRADDVERALDALVPRWIATDWPFARRATSAAA